MKIWSFLLEETASRSWNKGENWIVMFTVRVHWTSLWIIISVYVRNRDNTPAIVSCVTLEYLWRRRRDANWLSETGAEHRDVLKQALHFTGPYWPFKNLSSLCNFKLSMHLVTWKTCNMLNISINIIINSVKEFYLEYIKILIC